LGLKADHQKKNRRGGSQSGLGIRVTL